MATLKFLLTSIWRESGTVAKIFYGCCIILPGLLTRPLAYAIQRLLGVAEDNMIALTGSTSALIAMIAIGIWIIWGLAKTAVHQEAELSPKVSLSFVPDGGGMSITPEKSRHPLSGETLDEYQALYLRVRAETVSRKAARNCSAYLVSVAKRVKQPDGNMHFVKTPFVDPLLLPWAHAPIQFGELD